MRVTGKRVSQPTGESGTFAEQPKYETGRFVLQSLNCLPCHAVVFLKPAQMVRNLTLQCQFSSSPRNNKHVEWQADYR